MVREDAIAILSVLKASYPQTYRGLSKKDAEDVINLWTMMFDKESVAIVTEAVKALIYTNKFPPTIADVKEKIILMTETPAMSELEAWSLVNRAIKDSNYNSSKHFDNFPEVIKRAIRTPEQLRDWALMDIDTINSVVASNFMRSYKANTQYKQQMDRLPESTKIMIEGLKNKMLMEA